MTIRELFNDDKYPDIVLEDIMDDSRIESKNSVFFSLQGLTHDGHSFISQAIDNVAIFIVHSRDLQNKKEGVTYIHDPLLTENYPDYVNRFFKNPSSKLHLIGITGTNGKTTISTLIQYMMNHFKKSAYMGTIGFHFDGFDLPSQLTTSTLVNNQKYLDLFVNEGVEVVAMEASSQGIDLNRIDGLTFESAVFTNLTIDHLDYHLNMESYYQAKKKLFSKMDYSKRVIINIDDDFCLRLSKELVNPVTTVSMHNPEATVYIHSVDLTIDRTYFSLNYNNEIYEFETNFVSEYNLMNLVQSMMACVNLGVELEDLTEIIKTIPEITGRLQLVETDEDFDIIIDFAHSPDSMEKILQFCRSIVKDDGRIISLFGSAGRRDKSKRGLMGQVADKYSDLIYLTQDDPRDESVKEISQQIASGIFYNPYVIVESRLQAIHFAIHSARKNDIIVLMGKGPENTMAVGNIVVPYETDYNIAKESLMVLRKEKDEKY